MITPLPPRPSRKPRKIVRDETLAKELLQELQRAELDMAHPDGFTDIRRSHTNPYGGAQMDSHSARAARSQIWIALAAEESRDTARHEVAVGLPIDEAVVRLRGVLGAKLVAYIASVESTRVVRTRADGTALPEPGSEARLRTALKALCILAECLDPVTIGTWFQGMNTLLGDESPARAIRNRGPHATNDVLVAARSMLIE